MNDGLFIKSLKPRKNSRYHQGMIDPKTCKKYYSSCKNDPIIYRSGLELQFINYCEAASNVVRWASEPIAIPYMSRIDGHEVNYYPDYIIEDKNGNRCIIEIKPYNQTVKPRDIDSMWLKKAWIKNVDKWKAAKSYAESKGMKFLIVTEKFFNNI